MNTGSSVKDFVTDFYGGLNEGLQGKNLIMCPESEATSVMQLNVAATDEVNGKGGAKILGLFGAEVGASASNSSSNKITVFVKELTEVEKEREKAEIERLKAEAKFAVQRAVAGL